MTTVDETVATWQQASRDKDVDLLRRCLTPDVVMISPLTAAFRFHGPDQLCQVFGAAWEVLTDLSFHTGVGDEHTRALFFHATAGGQPVEEAQLLRFDRDGLVTELTLYGRPLPGVTAVMTGIAGPLLRRQGRPVAARLLTAATAPLALLTRLGERRVVPLADPAKGRR
ncbi:MAG TPA: nuclear transport factor 2 family protein [Mycobacteriales bacterium]